jgi:hypothetical protein
VRSPPVKPIAVSRSCTTSARTRPFDRDHQLLDLVQIVIDRPSPVLPRDRRLPGLAQRYKRTTVW